MSVYATYTDAELIRFLQQGDAKAFEAIYERYSNTLLAMAYNRLKDVSVAEDIVHDVFVSLWKNREQMQIRNFRNWIATAVKYMIIRAVDKAILRQKYQQEQRQQLVITASLTDERADEQLTELLKKEINQLPEKCRLVFRLRQQGLTNTEIAAEMNTSVKTVENQVNRGIRALRIAMKHYLCFYL